jgi:hypothetical protein
MSERKENARPLRSDEAGLMLEQIGMSLGDWGNIRSQSKGSQNWDRCSGPVNAHELYVFSQKILEWIPEGDWYLAQFDKSTWINPAQLFLFECIVGTAQDAAGINHGGAFLISDNDPLRRKVIVAHIMYLTLLFEGDVYVVSSACHNGPYLCIHDGFAYFIPGLRDTRDGKEFIRRIAAEPGKYLDWVVRYNVAESKPRSDSV